MHALKFSALLTAGVALMLIGALSPERALSEVGIRYASVGYQQITATGSAQSLTVPAGATSAEICVSTAAVRWRDDATDPTTSVGMPIAAATWPCKFYTGPLQAFRFIAVSGSPVLDVSYYK